MNSWRLGKIGGVEIRVDSSWAVIALLITYSLYLRFTTLNRTLPEAAGVGLAVAAALLFFGSILVHELAHAITARARKIPVRGITLFLFGGVTHAKVDSRTPKDEFLISIVGPGTSVVLAGLFWVLATLARGVMPDAVVDALGYLSWVNLLLAAFNLLPGLPLDGGRVLRSAIWQIGGNVSRATAVAAVGGQIVGFGLIGLGALALFTGNFIGGIWFATIGWFLAQAARASTTQLELRLLLERTRADAVMAPVESVPWEDWQVAASPAGGRPDPAVPPDVPASRALAELENAPAGRVLVVRDGAVVGVITSADVARWLERRTSIG